MFPGKGVLVWTAEEWMIIEHIKQGETFSGVTTDLKHPVMRWIVRVCMLNK